MVIIFFVAVGINLTCTESQATLKAVSVQTYQSGYQGIKEIKKAYKLAKKAAKMFFVGADLCSGAT